MDELNFLFDLNADWCDRHERAFKMSERCPKCNQAGAVPTDTVFKAPTSGGGLPNSPAKVPSGGSDGGR